jgi:hypothetical protein
MEIRDMERKHFAVKEYVKANQLRQQADDLEMLEIQRHKDQITQKIHKEEARLKKLHELQLNNLMKRVKRDRDEQIVHRKTDS